MNDRTDPTLERLSVALTAANVGVWDWQITSGETVFDDQYYRISGYEPGAFAPTYEEWRRRIHPDDVDEVERLLHRHLAGESAAYVVEFRFLRADGGWMWTHAKGRIMDRTPDGEPVRMVGIHMDITELKTARELIASILRGTEATVGGEFFLAFTRHLAEALGVTYAIVGELTGEDDGTITTLGVSARGAEAANMSYALAGTPCAEVIHREACVFAEGVQELFPDDPLLRRMGVEGYLGVPLHDPQGRPLGIIVLLSDRPIAPETEAKALPLLEVFSARAATELLRLRAEREVRRREDDLRITLESIGDAVIATDAAGRVTRLNPVAEELTGWRREEAQGRPLQEVFGILSAETGESLPNPVTKVLESGDVVGLALDTVLVSRDGQRRQIADSGAPIRNSAGEIVGVVLVFRDVTEQHRIEEQLRHSQRMDSLGQLAGGIAHDFNNMLGGILGYADLLAMQLEEDTEAHEYARAIARAGERAGELTGKLLSFSRKGKHTIEPFDLHTEIAAVQTLLNHTLDRNITVQTDLTATRSTVRGDAAQIQSAILNLGLNARDAMPEGGRLKIRTADVVVDGDGERLGLTSGDHILLEVSDTGVGMSAELLDHIFDPFFTTKSIGKGTGLGLAAVYGAVREHAGLVEVDSAPGEGSTFRILLPSLVTPAPAPARERDGELGGATVLVIDDEPLVREVVANMLKKAGCTVLTAADGAAGLEVYTRHRHEIGLVFLDVAMPVMGGAECFRRIREVDPEARVLVATGFVDGASVDDRSFPGRVGLLRKPFRRQELLDTVREALAPRRKP